MKENQMLLEYAQIKGLKFHNNQAVGFNGHFPILLVPMENIKNSYQLVLVFNRPLEKEIKKAFVAALKKVAAVRNVKETLVVVFGVKVQKGEDFSQRLEDILRLVNEVIAQYALQPATQCAVCKGEHCENVAAIRSAYAPVHTRCLDSMAEKARNEVSKNQNGNYVLGILGALVGAFVGMLPSILTILLMEVMYSLLYALIPLGAFYGYKLFRGKQNKVALVIICIISVIAAIAVNFFVLLFAIMSELGIGFSLAFGGVFLMMFSPEVMELMLGDTLFSLFSVLLGIWIVWRQITATPLSKESNIDNIMQTVQPNPANSQNNNMSR